VILSRRHGCRKNYFYQAASKELGVMEATSSLSLVNEYQTDNQIVYHFDFYRLKNETEALDMGG
jgi:tRNA threonylcarbamoyladenosine biosynthesis protein TsaE